MKNEELITRESFDDAIIKNVDNIRSFASINVDIKTTDDNYIIKNGEINLTESLPITGHKNIVSTKGLIINGIEKKEGDINISTTNAVLDNITANTKCLQGIFNSSNSENLTIKNCNITNDCKDGISVRIGNKANKLNFENNTVKGQAFGFLIDTTNIDVVNSSKNMYIANNHIFSNGGDCIELNFPMADLTKNNTVPKNIIVENNFLESTPNTDGLVTNPQCGFAIGVCNGRNVIINNNIIEESTLEAIHIEDCSQNINISNNIASNCNKDGITLAYNRRDDGINNIHVRSNPISITNNRFIKKNLSKTDSGIRIIDEHNWQYPILNINSNFVDGFDYGVSIQYQNETSSVNLDGTIVSRCNTGVLLRGDVKGKVYCYETPTLVNLAGNTKIEYIESSTPIKNLYTYSTVRGVRPAIINGFKFPIITNALKGNNSISIFNKPQSIVGRLNVFAFNNINKVNASFDLCKYRNGEFTYKKIFSYGGGSLDVGNIYEHEDKININLYSSESIKNIKIIIEFNGEYMVLS